MNGQRSAAVFEAHAFDLTRITNRRAYTRRDVILLGMSAAFGLAGAGIARTVYHDLTTPPVARARSSVPAGGRIGSAPPAPIDVSPPGHPMRILTEVPLTSSQRDEIAAEAARFARFGAGTTVTIRKSWRSADGSYGETTPNRIDLSDALLGDDPDAIARREIELPLLFARSTIVNLLPRR
jgi:hypothetical protein